MKTSIIPLLMACAWAQAETDVPTMLRAQVLLDRAHFSVGQIDGQYGSNMRQALLGFQQAHGLPATGKADQSTLAALDDGQPALIPYTITDTDLSGPFQAIPEQMADKARLPALGFASVEEALGERFHASPALLKKINRGKNLGRPGEEIMVPNIVGGKGLPKAATLIVSRSAHTLSLVDSGGQTIAQMPASTGSDHDPLPIGDWKVNGVARNPPFHYNPKLFWDASPNDNKVTIPPGPNNPVGVVWIDLSKDHYGIHGTPEPGSIGKTQSHGCIRLTNWDALLVADAVAPGFAVVLKE
jgi:lipoprotein-anchoring transpeptidase ErfK/SrfK